MNAGDVMTQSTVTVDPDASIMHAIQLMLKRRISGLPVVDDTGALVGILTEGDLLRRAELGTQKRRPRWIEFLIGPGRLASEYVSACGRKVHEVMTTPVHTVTEDAPLTDVVKIMESRQVKRLPVVRDNRSRRNCQPRQPFARAGLDRARYQARQRHGRHDPPAPACRTGETELGADRARRRHCQERRCASLGHADRRTPAPGHSGRGREYVGREAR